MSRTLGPILGAKPLPVGQRPKCRYCGKELRPQFRSHYPDRGSLRPTHRTFEGKYGSYGDNLFCGLNHGYYWAVRNAK